MFANNKTESNFRFILEANINMSDEDIDLPQIVVPVAMLVSDASFEASTRRRDVSFEAPV